MQKDNEGFVIQEISKLILKKRIEIGYSRVFVAQEIGLDEKQVRRIETGTSKLPLITVLKLFRVLDINIDVLKIYIEENSKLV